MAENTEAASPTTEKEATIHERLAAIVGCSVDDERVDALYDFIAADRQIEAAQSWGEGWQASEAFRRGEDGSRINPYDGTKMGYRDSLTL